MQTVKDISRVYATIADTVDISDELFFVAQDKYNELGIWLDEHLPEYSLAIYAQGSFALGTVVKPLTSDEYDLDLVCEFAEQYGLSAKDMKCSVVGPALRQFGKLISVKEKKRCWQVRYETGKAFHMDIVPSYDKISHIDIANKSDNGEYTYKGSNPRKYIEWFCERMKVRYEALREARELEFRAMMERAEIVEIPRYRIKTPLQKMIQILKRHRDIMFINDKDGVAPISILISTIAASLYENEEDVYTALENFLKKAPSFVINNMENGKYIIANPVYTGPVRENFAEKWSDHPERAAAFFDWIEKARVDLANANIKNETRIQMADRMKSAFGDASIKAYERMAIEDSNAIQSSKLRVDTKTGILSSAGTKIIPPHHHHGKE